MTFNALLNVLNKLFDNFRGNKGFFPLVTTNLKRWLFTHISSTVISRRMKHLYNMECIYYIYTVFSLSWNR